MDYYRPFPSPVVGMEGTPQGVDRGSIALCRSVHHRRGFADPPDDLTEDKGHRGRVVFWEPNPEGVVRTRNKDRELLSQVVSRANNQQKNQLVLLCTLCSDNQKVFLLHTRLERL